MSHDPHDPQSRDIVPVDGNALEHAKVRDLVETFLQRKSENTRRAYESDLRHFAGHVDGLITYLKSSRLMEGFDEILMPGEMEHRKRRQREAEGVDVDDETWRQIRETAESVGVTL